MKDMSRPEQPRTERFFNTVIAIGMVIAIIVVPPFNVLFALAFLSALFTRWGEKRRYRKARRQQKRAERRQGEYYLPAEEAEFDWTPPSESPTQEFQAIRTGRSQEEIRRDQLAFAEDQERRAHQ